MTEPNGWLDMSRFPDHDPDTVLTGDQHDLLTSALTVDDADLPDAVWEHMLAAVVGPADDPSDNPAVDDDPTTDDPALDADDTGWTPDLERTLGLDDHAPVDDHHGEGAEDHAVGTEGFHPGGEGGTP